MDDVYLVVGLGSMGKRRIRDLKTLGVPRIIGVDRREDRRLQVEEKYGVATTDNYEEALSLNPKAVVVSVPPHLHYRMIAKALEAGAAYFVECLPVLSLEEMDDLIDREKANPGFAFPSCTLSLFESTDATVRFLKRAGRLYSMHFSRSSWLPNQHPWEKQMGDHYEFHRAQGGGLAEIAYDLSGILPLLNERAVSVTAKAKHVSDLPEGFNDVLDMILEFEGGAIMNYHYSLHEKHDGSVGNFQRFCCEGGTIMNSPRESDFFNAGTKEWERFCVPTDWDYESVYLREMEVFVDALNQRRPYPGKLETERLCLAILLAAEESGQSKQEVAL